MFTLIIPILIFAVLLALLNMDSIKKALLFVVLIGCTVLFIYSCLNFPGLSAIGTSLFIVAGVRLARNL
ncbi:hypothetical protein ACL9RF_03110 [Sphingobacterium sp. Mn56C]|uniref:hypothetical protein n=1 Tax=Sphingobacterium sp. Mn56C TaxID=3395261 RepID=UPI003BED923A